MNEPRYPVLVVEASPDDVDALIGRLTLLGAEGIEERDATTLSRGGALGVTLVANFADDSSAREAHDALAGEFSVRLDAIVGDAWRDAWKAHWTAARLTERVVVVPSWIEHTPEPGDLVLKLDPGRAFGTGQHASTALAARALERRLPALGAVTVLDLGTGSGILSFVARLLGAPAAIGCDTDPEAIACARENAELGAFSGVDLRVGGVEVVPERSTLVVANIEPGVLVPFAEAIAARVLPGGALVLSGVLAEQKDAVVAAYERQGLALDRCDQEGAWVSPEMVRRGS